MRARIQKLSVAVLLAGCSTTRPLELTTVNWPARPRSFDAEEVFRDPGPVDLSDDLRLDRVIELAAERNPRLAVARRKWLAARERPSQARALPDPLLTYTEMISPTETRVGPLDRQFKLTQRIPYPGKLDAAGQLAEEQASVRALEYRIALRDTIADVKVVFFELLYLRKAIRIVSQNQVLAKQLAEKSAAIYAKTKGEKRDVVTLFDTLKAQSQLAQLAYDSITLEELRLTETANLNRLLSRPPRAPLGMPGELRFRPVAADLDTLYRLGLKRSQELRASVRRIAAAAQSERLARLARVPDFSIAVTYGVIGDPVAPVAGGGDDTIGLSLGLSLPIWETKNRARIAEAKYLRMAAVHARQSEIDKLMARITKVVFRMENAERLVRLYKESLIPQAEQAMEIAEQWRDAGRDTIGRYLEAQSVWLNFQLAYHRALTDHEQMVARLEQLVGTSLGHLRGKEKSDEDK